MREEIKYFVYVMGIGFILLAYAHANFASKSTVEKMDQRIYEIYQKVVEKK